MRFQIKIIALFMAAQWASVFAQTHLQNERTALAVETYAFLKGQDAALQAVAAQFPDLRDEVAIAYNKLQGTFSRAQNNIRHYLATELPANAYNALEQRIDSLLSLQLKIPIAHQKHAEDFLKLVEQRTHFIPDTTLYKGIASFTYHDAPHEEMAEGHVHIFSTDGHPKADDGASLKIHIPKSWLAEETQMPQSIKQFTSCHGKGLEKIVLLAFELPSEYKGIVLDKNKAAEMLPPQSRMLRIESLLIEGRPAVMAEVEENINGTMKIRMLQFMFIHDDRLYCLQGSIGPVEADRNLGPHLKKYEPLFRLVASSTDLDSY